MPFRIRAGMTLHDNRALASPHDHTRNFVVIRRQARSRERFEISNTPAGAKAFHDFLNEIAVEADLEVGIAKAFLFEPEREGCDFAVTGHDDRNTSDGRTKIDPFPAGTGFAL